MAPRYRVTLNQEERDALEDITQKGKRSARMILNARALLLLDQGNNGPAWLVKDVAEAIGRTTRSLELLKKRFLEEGALSAIERKKRITPPREIQFGGEFEAHLIALACSDCPEGRTRWTIQLLAEQMVELKFVETVSTMTVWKTLKKINLNLI